MLLSNAKRFYIELGCKQRPPRVTPLMGNLKPLQLLSRNWYFYENQLSLLFGQYEQHNNFVIEGQSLGVICHKINNTCL